MNKGIILLSGGLDSLVSLGLAKDEYNVELAITFDYGQKSAQKEIGASEKICDYYKIEHKVIKLDWLKNITDNSLTNDDKMLPKGLDNPYLSVKSVWVPNRNGLFLNVAAAFAESGEYTHIIIGANKEEAQTFPDNSKDFIDCVNQEFKFSTLKAPKVIAPLINYDKNDIVNLALKNSMPLNLIQSCYDSIDGHCGVCESCTRLRNALKYNKDVYYTNLLFKN